MKLKKMTKMKRLFLMTIAVATVAFAGCSQSKQSHKAGSTQKAVPAASKTAQSTTSATSATPGDGKVNYLTTADFKKKIMNYEKHPREWVYEGNGPVVIDFYATWCGPCKRTSPIVEELAKDYSGKITFYKVDIDKERELATVFGIQSVPTFLFIPTNGKPTAQIDAMEKQDFEEIINSVIFN